MNINDSQILPGATHDEAARLSFVSSLRAHLSGQVMPGNYDIYAARIEPSVVEKTGRPPAGRDEVRRIMTGVPYYQWWSALLRRSQEMMWDCGIEVTERQLPVLIETFRNLRDRDGKDQGSLQLDPHLPLPRYLTAADIHIQPGGYHTEQAESDDVAAGAIFETGIQAYGWGINLGGALLKHFHQHWPDFRPARILDLGCTIGTSTLPWAAAFPDAVVHAIDAAAPILRYGHARARSMGVKVHFSQQNAEETRFEAGSFDLVLSHILLHETSKKALPRILAECRRLLRPGGLMLHLEVPRGDTPMEQFMHDWESYNNNESFSRFMTDIDLCAEAVKAGWLPEEVGMQIVNPKVGFGKKNYVQGEVLFNLLVGRR
ncbi:MAG: class I SAM-dependent methyltransferase [Gammaproteobacteria bacterium]